MSTLIEDNAENEERRVVSSKLRVAAVNIRPSYFYMKGTAFYGPLE